MSDDRTSDETPKVSTETPEPVPEADALEQAEEVVPVVEEEDVPSDDPEVPEADAIEQSQVVPNDDDVER
jgi:hypothetical protein